MENQHFLSQSANELVEKLKEKYSLGQAQVYNRLKHLAIRSCKGDGKVWLNNEQFTLMEALHQHIQEGGEMSDYAPAHLEAQGEETAIVQAQQQVITEQFQSAEQNHHQPQFTGFEQVAAIDSSAQAKAAGMMIFETMLEAKYRENPELLPPELQEKIEQAKVQYAPKRVDPFEYAQALIRGQLKVA